MAITPVTSAVPAGTPPTPLTSSSSSGSGSSGLSFSTVLDAVNPLQHIPVLSGLYRAATGSQISSVSQVTGDTFYGALLPGGAIGGLVSSLVDVGVKQVTGQSIGQYVVGAITPSSGSTPSSTPVATPLVANSPTLTSQSGPTIPTLAPIPLGAHASHLPNNQYQRIQTMDKLHVHLLKMTT